MSKTVPYTPWRFRPVGEKILVTNEVGEFEFYDPDLPERFFDEKLNDDEEAKLKAQSILVPEEESWRYLSLAYRTQKYRDVGTKKLSYLIVIPTLRCNLSCSYCQVSRAPENAKGYDWDDIELEQFSNFLKENGSDGMKIEFQGGEPTLRVDLLSSIIDISEDYFSNIEFVICSNLTQLSKDFLFLLERENVIVSTSIDGAEETMTTNRTFDNTISDNVIENIQYILKKFGHKKLAALPTITESQIDEPEKVIDYYRKLGFNSIFLRPVNYQGFARKAHTELSHEIDKWHQFYIRAMDHILTISEMDYFEEFYTRTLLRKIFCREEPGFVDFRSPARYSQDYCVIDFDGKIYPTDESRMLSRTHQIDLCIGSLSTGLNREAISELNFNAIHHINEDCTHCAYMPYCGIDVIDDMSRYGRFDNPKETTWYCRKHLYLFDFIFEKIEKRDQKWLKLFNSWIHRSRNTSDALEIFR